MQSEYVWWWTDIADCLPHLFVMELVLTQQAAWLRHSVLTLPMCVLQTKTHCESSLKWNFRFVRRLLNVPCVYYSIESEMLHDCVAYGLWTVCRLRNPIRYDTNRHSTDRTSVHRKEHRSNSSQYKCRITIRYLNGRSSRQYILLHKTVQWVFHHISSARHFNWAANIIEWSLEFENSDNKSKQLIQSLWNAQLTATLAWWTKNMFAFNKFIQFCILWEEITNFEYKVYMNCDSFDRFYSVNQSYTSVD